MHYDENKNDEIRGRGSFRQVIHSIKYLCKYGFNPIIDLTNYYNEDVESILENLKTLFNNIGFETKDRNICINKCYRKDVLTGDVEYTKGQSLDCEYGRMLTVKGIYACPFLANDHRGRCGSDFTDFSEKINLETPYCNTCLDNQRQVFSINFSDFKY